MDGTVIHLLHYLSIALGSGVEKTNDSDDIDYYNIFMLSQIHHVAPMIYPIIKDTLADSKEYKSLLVDWRRISVSRIMDQYNKTEKFLEIYEKLTNAGIKALVLKGIILRRLYKEPDSRISSDEDILIRKSDFWNVHQILTELGMRTKLDSDGVHMPYEIKYTLDGSKFTLEVHTSLFDPDMMLFVAYNDCFTEIFDMSIVLQENDIALYTLSHTHHLLFLILHTIKHFCGSGVGIRQICDIVIYFNTFGEELDFEFIWNRLMNYGMDYITLNIFDIGIRYLGLDLAKNKSVTILGAYEVKSDALLLDIMGSGIYGKCAPDEGTSRVYTINGLHRQRYENKVPQRNWLFLRTIFPNKQNLGHSYQYCQEYPSLIVVAWFHRIIRYILREKKPGRMIYIAIMLMQLGNERLNLMKEYKLIDKNEIKR